MVMFQLIRQFVLSNVQKSLDCLGKMQQINAFLNALIIHMEIKQEIGLAQASVQLSMELFGLLRLQCIYV